MDRLARSATPVQAPLGARGTQLIHLIFAAGEGEQGRILDRIQAWLDKPDDWPGMPHQDELLVYLYRLVERRVPAWMRAWELLGRVRGAPSA